MEENICIGSIQEAQAEYEKKYPGKIITRDFYRKFLKERNEYFLNKKYIEIYGSFASLLEAAGLSSSDTGVTRESLSIVKKTKPGIKKYFVTSIIAGADIEVDFVSAIINYCKINNCEPVFLAMIGVTSTDVFSEDIIKDYGNYIATEFQFNKNLVAMDLLLNPQQLLPLTGLPRLGKKEHSVIVAHPKQMLVSVPNKREVGAHIVLSTGTINTPKYRHSRQGRLAAQDNLLGGVIVEIQNSKIFYVRQVQWLQECFYDLNKKYTKDKVITESPEAMVLGDLHLGEQDDIALQCSKEIIKYTGVRKIFFHDLVSMRSISHHEENDLYAKYTRPDHQKTLQKELNYAGNWLKTWIKDIHKDCDFIVVKSNHDEHLERYLSEGRFVTDHINVKLAAELFIKYLDDLNPLEEYLIENFESLRTFNFLVRDESYEIAGIECGSHGDVGNNGAKGSMQSFELNFGKSVVAHSHSPAIFREVWRVGTNSKLKLPYTKGGSSWLHSDCLIFKNGSRQLIIKINGKWKI